jgi:MFS family permease
VNAHVGSWKGVAFGVGIAAFAAYHQFKLPVMLPVLLERYGYERALAGGFVSVYALAGLVLSVWAGSLVERRGAVAPVLAAMGLMFAGCALTLLQPASGLVVLAARALEGLGFTVLGVAGPVLANANAPPRSTSLVMALSATWIPVGQLSATALAPLALATSGWSLLWWLGMAGAVVAAGATLTLRGDPGVVLAPAVRADGAPPASRSGTPRRRERTTLLLVACVFGLWSGQYFAYMTWLPQYLVEIHALAVSGALAGYVVPVVFVAVFNLVAGALLRAGVALGALMTGAIASQVAVWWLLPVTAGDWSGVLSLVVYGIGAGIVPTCLFAAPGAVLGPGRSTAPAFGMLMAGRNLGVLIGPVLLAWVAGDGERWHDGTRVFASATTVAMLLAAVFWRRSRHDEDRRYE